MFLTINSVKLKLLFTYFDSTYFIHLKKMYTFLLRGFVAKYKIILGKNAVIKMCQQKIFFSIMYFTHRIVFNKIDLIQHTSLTFVINLEIFACF